MSRTILANVEGFTPIIDAVVTELGLMPAVIFGRIWRYCQMDDQVCKASLETIGDSIGVDKATVMRHAKALCDAGYLKDLSPDLRNRPHVYVDTGKAGIAVSFSGVAQRNVEEVGVADSNVTVAQRNVTVAESKLNKDLKKDLKTPLSVLSKKDYEQVNAKVDAMIENATKPKKYDNRDKMPETYWTYSDLYHELTGQPLTKRVLLDWMATFEDWKQEGLQPEHIRAAWQHANRPEGGFMVGRPGALTVTAVAMKSKMIAAPPAPQLDRAELERTRKLLEEKERVGNLQFERVRPKGI